jgi:hypothetical protein
LCEARRPNAAEPFGETMLIKELDSPSSQSGPFLTGDGLTLLYESGVGPNHQGGKDIYQSHRRDRNSPWEKPVNLGPKVNTKADETGPCLSRDGLVLFFASDRPGGQGDSDLWRSRRKSVDAPFETPENLGSGVNSEASEISPRLCADNLTLLFTRAVGATGRTVFRASPDAKGTWTAQPLILPVDGPVQAACLARDGRTLYFAAHLPNGQGGNDLWQIRRVPKAKTPQ